MKHFIALLSLMGFAHAQTFEAEAPPRASDYYESASYRLWIPPGLPSPIRGVVVLQHGCGEPAGARALSHADDPQWRAFAAQNGFALVATRLSAAGDLCASWARPERGTGPALERGLEKLALAAGRPELGTAPLYLWGHSGGGAWAVSFAAHAPHRVRAVVAVSGACSPERGEVVDVGACGLQLTPEFLALPILFRHGAREGNGDFLEHFVERLRALSAEGEARGAWWPLVVDPAAGHDTGNVRDLSMRFFFAAAVGSRAGKNAFAAAARAYANTGKVPDQTAPPAPHDVRVRAIVGGAVVSWSANVDPESGLDGFRVYRDSLLIAERRGWAADDPAHTGPFLAFDYFDQPIPPPPMRIAVSGDAAPEHIVVTSVNRAGLESAASAPAKWAE